MVVPYGRSLVWIYLEVVVVVCVSQSRVSVLFSFLTSGEVKLSEEWERGNVTIGLGLSLTAQSHKYKPSGSAF